MQRNGCPHNTQHCLKAFDRPDRPRVQLDRPHRTLRLRGGKTEVTGADGAAIEITNVALDELEALIGITEEAARGSE